MGKRASVKYRSLRTNLVHLPLSLYTSLAQQHTRPQGIIIHLSPISSSTSSSSKRPQEGYLGWSGLASASSLAGGLAGIGGGDGSGETVEVDPEVAMDLGWAEGTIVEISIIHHPTRAMSVSVTPLSSDDWEILEEHASFLENNLLSQLRAAGSGQEVNVWVLGNTKIRIRIDGTDPSVKDSAVLIGPDTEIYVAPRPRRTTSWSSSQPQLVAGGLKVERDEKGKSPMTGPSIRLRLVPGAVGATWGDPPAQTGHVSASVALCSPTTIARLRKRLKIKDKDPVYALLRIQEDQQTPKGKSRDSGHPPPGHEESPEETEDDGKSLEVTVVPWDEVPEGHAFLAGDQKPRWSHWAIVRAYTGSKQSIMPRQKQGTGQYPRLSGLPLPLPLPGPDGLIAQAFAYFHRSFQDPSPRSLLLTGAKGTGKTNIIRHLGRLLASDREILTEPIYHDISKLDVGGRLPELKEKMVDWLEDATRRRPSFLVLDGLEHLLHPQNELNSSSAPTALAETFCRLFAPHNIPSGLLVVATTTTTSALHPLLNAKHTFGQEIKIPIPDRETRQEILRRLVGDCNSADTSRVTVPAPDDGLDLVALSSLTEGYTPADLTDVVELVLQESIVRCAHEDTQGSLLQADFVTVLESFTPANLKGVKLQQSEVQWSDIGGLHEPRRVLRETLEWPTKYAQIFASSPLRLRSGLLLYGYPGCGKTLLASAVAKECGLNFISIKGPEVLNKYIGASEKAIRDLFERAQGAKPCVLFFDEFDSIAPKRGHDSTGVTDRVVNQLLTEMDGAQGLEGVYVLAATSRPDLIDPALLRPGRLDKAILCDMPSVADRLEILQTLADKMSLAPAVDLELIAQETEGCSGADLQAVMYNAHLEVVQSSIKLSDGSLDNSGIPSKGKGKAEANGNVPHEPAMQNRKAWKQVAPLDGVHDPEAIQRLDTLMATLKALPIEADNISTEDMVKPAIEQHHLLRSLGQTRASVSAADYQRLSLIYRAFMGHRDGAMGNGDFGRDTGTRVSLM